MRRFTSKKSIAGLALLVAIGATYALAVGTKVESNLQAPKSGIVLDAETNKPLAGVSVVIRWHEEITDPFMIGHGNIGGGGCVHRIIVQTDVDGRYSIPSSRSDFAVEHNFKLNRSVKYYWDLYAYKDGYGSPGQQIPSGVGPIYEGHPRAVSDGWRSQQTVSPVLLGRPEGTPEPRISELLAVYYRFMCKPEHPSPPPPVAEHLYKEAYATACTPTPNRAALKLDEFRNLISPSLTTDATDEISSIKKRHGQMSKEPLAREEAARLCAMLGPNKRELQ